MEQGTDEWFQARLGKVTASRIADVMATLKNGTPGAGRKNYAAQLICERLTGLPTETFTNSAMQWGTDTEPQARGRYSLETFNPVEQVGFVDHPSIPMAGASPDGLVNDRGLVEIKCPNSATHIETLRGAPIDAKYIKQMQFQMLCCERDWCDFVSFDPRLPDEMQIHIQRVERDDELCREIEDAVRAFLTEVDAACDELIAKYREDAA